MPTFVKLGDIELNNEGGSSTEAVFLDKRDIVGTFDLLAGAWLLSVLKVFPVFIRISNGLCVH